MLDFYVSQVLLNGPEGELDAEGLTFESPLDMRYTKSSVCESLKLISRFYDVPFFCCQVRMVYARMWDVKDFDEGNR